MGMDTTSPESDRVLPERVPPERTLSGYTVGVTAARRADEFAALLTRRGAVVLHAPAIVIIPLADDAELERVSREIIQNPPDVAVATTGIGFRGWLEAAEGWGVAEELRNALQGSRLVARGPKATGAIRAAGLREAWSPSSESSSEVLERLLEEGVQGLRVAVQLHGATTEFEPLPDFSEALQAAGAQVLAVPVYRWEPPHDQSAMDALIAAVAQGTVDGVSFTSAPAVASMLGRAKETGMFEQLLDGFRAQVAALCVGPVTAAPLEALGVPTSAPARSRLGALARHIEEELPRRAKVFRAHGHTIAVLARAVVVDGEVRHLAPSMLTLLRALARQPGRVVTREALLASLPGHSADAHAVEAAIGRLRTGLGDPKIVQTVVKRGYRLAADWGVDDFGASADKY
ncbi:Uroporphyrinogen III synthase HEM4 [Segniliparus rotundus DSM 44985]|uniref:Uroporphyrinogen III synthase HEM4 n=2 Tax=Segniliparus rotundus TaxID=286802 RepID=D6ZCJ8_SEGRD|nr:Uroporphyrinogen III synthase HEM4 [Segniliparus rotundus DSM 44985]